MFMQQLSYNKLCNKVKINNINKMEALKSKQKNLFNSTNESWLKNITDTQIPQLVEDFLALGPKFSLPVGPRDVDVFRLVSEVESIISMIPEQHRNVVRSKATNYIHYKADSSSPKSYLEKITR